MSRRQEIANAIDDAKIVCLYGHDPDEECGEGERPINAGDREWIKMALQNGVGWTDVTSINFEEAEDQGVIVQIGTQSEYLDRPTYSQFRVEV